jgi:hypothetical protein
MNKIEEKHLYNVNNPSDIYQHLDTLKHYAAQCKHITEFGVRNCVSTWSLLAGKPDKMISYDINRSENIVDVEKAAQENNISFKFIQQDVLTMNIEKTDLLFIDTLHTYDQLYAELAQHGNDANKYIILHDTYTFGDAGEDGKSPGLIGAIKKYLQENKQWSMVENRTHNNGLMVLKRSI